MPRGAQDEMAQACAVPSIFGMSTPISTASACRPISGSSPLRILIVDDQPVVREGLKRLLAAALRSRVETRTTATSAATLEAAAAFAPHVVVLDVDLAGEDGLALIPQLKAHAGVFVLTCHGDAATRERAMQLGARAFVEKHEPSVRLIAAVSGYAFPHSGEEESLTAPSASSQLQPVESSNAQRPTAP